MLRQHEVEPIGTDEPMELLDDPQRPRRICVKGFGDSDVSGYTTEVSNSTAVASTVQGSMVTGGGHGHRAADAERWANFSHDS